MQRSAGKLLVVVRQEQKGRLMRDDDVMDCAGVTTRNIRSICDDDMDQPVTVLQNYNFLNEQIYIFVFVLQTEFSIESETKP